MSSLRTAIIASAAALFFLLGANSAVSQKKPSATPLNLNTATIEQLEQLPGIGPNTAKSIVEFRERSGPFQRIEDLLAIKGIFEGAARKAAALRHGWTSGAQPSLGRPVPGFRHTGFLFT